MNEEYLERYLRERYTSLLERLERNDMLFMVCMRLNFNERDIDFFNYLFSAAYPEYPTSTKLVYQKFFEIYYILYKLVKIGNLDIFNEFESYMSTFANDVNQGRYWNKMLKLSPRRTAMIIEQILKKDRFQYIKNYLPSIPELSTNLQLQKTEETNEVDENGNIVYY